MHVFIVSGTIVFGLITCYHIHLVSHILSWPTDQFLDGLWCGSGSAGKTSAPALKLNLSGSPCCVFECNILRCTHAVISCLSKVLSLSLCLCLHPPEHTPLSPSLSFSSTPSTSVRRAPAKPAAGWGLPSSGLKTQQGGRALDPA